MARSDEDKVGSPEQVSRGLGTSGLSHGPEACLGTEEHGEGEPDRPVLYHLATAFSRTASRWWAMVCVQLPEI